MNTETSTLIDSDFPLFNIGKEYTFVSDLPESITSQFDNSYIDKTLTGCGFTTWILQNNDSFIIASPYKGLIDCKVEQSNNDTTGFYPYKVFPFYYDENNKHQKDDLSFYITQQEKQNHPIKIMVTYDSVPRVLRYLDELKYDIKQTKLFVDECHKVLEFAGSFKPKVIDAMTATFDSFKSVIAATATPTRTQFIPKAFDNFKPIKLHWGGHQTKLVTKHINISNGQFRNVTLSFALAHLKGESHGNAYFFINSVKFAAAIVQLLIKNFGYSSDNFNIIHGKTEENTKTLKPLKLKQRSSLTDFCKVNFITSTAFEGQDFMDPDGVTYVLSNGKLEHTKIDISTQLPQIAGRLRCSKYKHMINFIWSYAFTEGETNYDVYEEKTIIKDLDVTTTVPMFHVLTETLKTFAVIGARGDIWFLNDKDDKDELIKNENAKNHLLNAFIGTQLQYFVHIDSNKNASIDNILERTDEFVNYSLNDILGGKIESNLNIPDLSPADKLKLGKIPNFAKLVKEYAEAVFKRSIALPNTDEWYDAHEIAKAIEENPAYTDIVDYVKEYGFESALSYSEKSSTLSSAGVKRKLEKAKGKSIIKEILEREITPGITLTYAQVNELLKNIYDKHGITDKPKKSHIDFAFKTVKSTILENGKQISVIRIKDKIN